MAVKPGCFAIRRDQNLSLKSVQTQLIFGFLTDSLVAACNSGGVEDDVCRLPNLPSFSMISYETVKSIVSAFFRIASGFTIVVNV